MAVHFVDTSGWSRDKWFSYRGDGVGASDLGTIMNLNPYMSNLELFHQKIGLLKPRNMNLRMHLGHISEPLIAELWSYWDKDETKFLNNVANRNQVRIPEIVNGYMRNDLYENLFVSLDYRFEDKRFSGKCNLELKNKTSLSYKQYISEMNPMEVVQMAGQMLVSEYQYSEIAYFIDNTRLEVLSMTYKDALALKPSIMKAVKDFWGRVESARICMNKIENAKNNYNMKAVAELEMELLSYEPIGQGEAYLDYLTERAKDKKSSIPLKGNEEQLALAKDLRKLSIKRKKIEKQEVEIKAKLAQQLCAADKTEFDFGKDGSFSITNGRITNKVK